jgi:hypothetical protein
MNDIVAYPFEGYNPAAYEQALKDEFDQLYEEGGRRRRMMVISLHTAFLDMPTACGFSTASWSMRDRSQVSGSPTRTRLQAGHLPTGR